MQNELIYKAYENYWAAIRGNVKNHQDLIEKIKNSKFRLNLFYQMVISITKKSTYTKNFKFNLKSTLIEKYQLISVDELTKLEDNLSDIKFFKKINVSIEKVVCSF